MSDNSYIKVRDWIKDSTLSTYVREAWFKVIANKIVLFVLASIGAIGVWCWDYMHPPRVLVVEGQIVIYDTDTPISGALVTVEDIDKRVKTGYDGRFRMVLEVDADAEAIWLNFHKDRYESAETMRVEIPKDETTALAPIHLGLKKIWDENAVIKESSDTAKWQSWLFSE